MKTIILVLGFSILASSIAINASATTDIPTLADIAKDSNGRVMSLSPHDAYLYCQNRDERLPTILELALWATQYGAKVSDSQQSGFGKISVKNSTAKPSIFYYQDSAYNAPTEEISEYKYWSSDLDSDDPHITFALSGFFGHVLLGGSTVNLPECAIRCVKSH